MAVTQLSNLHEHPRLRLDLFLGRDFPTACIGPFDTVQLKVGSQLAVRVGLINFLGVVTDIWGICVPFANSARPDDGSGSRYSGTQFCACQKCFNTLYFLFIINNKLMLIHQIPSHQRKFLSEDIGRLQYNTLIDYSDQQSLEESTAMGLSSL